MSVGILNGRAIVWSGVEGLKAWGFCPGLYHKREDGG